MSDRDEFERTIVYGDNALKHMHTHELAAYPKNYELLYTYSAGYNQALNKAVNETIRVKGKLSSDDMQRLYDEMLSSTRAGDRVEEVGCEVSGEINQVVAMIEATIGKTANYNQSLAGATSELQSAESNDQIRTIVQDLIMATREMDDHSKDLEKSLDDSRKQISELNEKLEAIRFEALTDQLTSLGNRKLFDETIEQMIKDADATGKPFVLLLTDIDHFKKFNDTYGHQTGDQVLRLVALSLKHNVKGQDTAARYGGEEFGVLLPNTTLDNGETVAEHIRKAVMAKELVKRSTGENLGRITISLGVAMYKPGETSADIIERADICLYAAKKNGRNCVITEMDQRYRDMKEQVA